MFAKQLNQTGPSSPCPPRRPAGTAHLESPRPRRKSQNFVAKKQGVLNDVFFLVKEVLNDVARSSGQNIYTLVFLDSFCVYTEKSRLGLRPGGKRSLSVNFAVARAQNHTWAEIGMVVQSAISFAMVRSYQNYEQSIEVTMDDFMNAIKSIVPVLERHRLNGMVSCGDQHKLTYEKAMQLVELVEMSTGSSLVTCLLEGPSGSGKTALAATVSINSGFPFVEFVSAETMIGLDEQTKCARIVKVFEDAYKSSLSIVILDDLERLLGYAAIGPQFSESISQTLSALLKRGPPEGKKLLMIGTTSQVSFLDSVDLCDAFSVTYHVPALKTEDAKKVLEQLKVFSEDDVDAAAEALNNMPIKKLYTLIEMAAQGEHGGAAEAIYSGREKIKISHFCDCLRDVVRC